MSNFITINDMDGDADWNGSTLTVQITTNGQLGDRFILSRINNGGIWLSDTTLMFNTTAIGSEFSKDYGLGFTFNTSATNALVQETAREIQFTNDSDAPYTVDRTITFTATDKYAATASATQTLSVIAVNDAPTIRVAQVTGVFSGNTGYAESVVLQDDGKIIVAGY